MSAENLFTVITLKRAWTDEMKERLRSITRVIGYKKSSEHPKTLILDIKLYDQEVRDALQTPDFKLEYLPKGNPF